MLESIGKYSNLPAIVKSKDGKQVRKFKSVKPLLMLEDNLLNGFTVEDNMVVISAKDEFFDLDVGLS